MKIQIQNLRRDELCESLTNNHNGIFGARGTRPSGAIRRRAFTLVELMLVVTIIGILAALVIPKIAGRGEEAREKAAYADIHGGIKTALDSFEVDNGFYPKSLQDLVQQPSNARNWHGPYFDPPVLPVDPWGNPYIYYYPGKHNQSGYDLLSTGQSGKEGDDDNIVSWVN
jgi:general secretion pathway protein G